nr:hypothetical protein [Tanacetum cinerariifolium]
HQVLPEEDSLGSQQLVAKLGVEVVVVAEVIVVECVVLGMLMENLKIVAVVETCSSASPSSSITPATNMPSNKGVSTPKNPFPTLLMLANTFWVRAGENLEVLSTFLTRLSKMYLEKLNLLPVDKQMTADAIAELNSFHDVHLALIDCRIVWMRNFYLIEKKAL